MGREDREWVGKGSWENSLTWAQMLGGWYCCCCWVVAIACMPALVMEFVLEQKGAELSRQVDGFCRYCNDCMQEQVSIVF